MDRKEYMRKYQLEWMRKRRQDWIDENGPCVHCGSDQDLEVDHIDASTKVWTPAKIWSRKQEDRDAELAKCQVLCEDCHKKKTLKSREHARGEAMNLNVLNKELVIYVRQLRASGMTYSQIEKETGVHKDTVRSAVDRKTWKHIN